MTDFDKADVFSDYAIAESPHAFFEYLRAQGPVTPLGQRNVVAVTGYDEGVAIFRDDEHFSAINTVTGPFLPLTVDPQADLDAQISACRQGNPFLSSIMSEDLPEHDRSKAILSGIITPARLKANEQFMYELADQIIDEFIDDGVFDVVRQFGQPFAQLVVADLLGVPKEDRQIFMDAIAKGPVPGALDGTDPMAGGDEHPFAIMGTYFYGYLADRRANPRDDILTEFAHARYNDGTTPELYDLVQLGMFMFGAGQDTSAKLLGNSMKYLVADQALQSRLRAEPKLIGAFLEEVLRIEGSTKQTARLARKDSKIGDVEIPAGTKILVALSAANRDPRRWDDPNELIIGRKKVIEHLGFGRGKHVCAGAPLARVEVRVIMEKFLEMTSKIELDLEKHPGGISDLHYEPSFIIRGLDKMHVKLTPAEGFVAPAKKAEVSLAAKSWSTADSRIGDLLGDEAARAVLDRHFPGMSENPQIGMAKGMTLRAVQAFAADQFTNEALDAVDADLAKLGN